MCYAHGSIDQAVEVCPMCRVFPHARCPHQRSICRNRAAHPRIDVSYLTNAEVDSFNGCGYCKWAQTNPPSKLAGFSNPGWPGCCRPPAPNEYKYISAADWRPVSIVHQVPIPAEIRAALEHLGRRGSPVSGGRTSISTKPGTMPAMERRGSGNSSPSRSSAASKNILITPLKPRTSTINSSPKLPQSSHFGTLPRSSSATTISSSAPSIAGDLFQTPRRQSIERRGDGSQSLNSSPKRRDVELDQFGSIRRGSSTKLAPSSGTLSEKMRIAPSTETVRRRGSVSTTQQSSSKSSSPPRPRTAEQPVNFVVPRSRKKDEDEMSCASSSSGSSDSLSSGSEGTVTSDGGFTDYLSDESEAELQRQAEAKAAVVAQNQAEELEFRAARQQLAHIDLRPPKVWSSTIPSNTSTNYHGRSATLTQVRM